MSSECSFCRTGLACKQHPNLPHPLPVHPSSLHPVADDLETENKLPQAFRFYQPSQPVTLSKPWGEHSDSERARIVVNHPPAGPPNDNAKRKAEEALETNIPSSSKRQATGPQTSVTVHSKPPSFDHPHTMYTGA
ncbi:hypothetical protein FRC12_003105 [Ceratobasidium sp. 428]|nr:hypothetical protein FRC12_003105 [Ceratobasidium sp. 428]